LIGYAIKSVLRQTERDFELLIVGDGCTDNTADVVQGFLDERIRWFDLPKAPNFGYANRNQVLREARGELIAFIGHDDLLMPDHLRLLGRLFRTGHAEWGYSRPLWVADDGMVVPSAIDLRKPSHLNLFMTGFNAIPAQCVMYRRTCHERYGYWPEETIEAGDWQLWKSFLGPSAGANLVYEPVPTALHFRANWRTGETWAPPPLPAWLEIGQGEEWPDALRRDVPPGELVQAVFSEELETAADTFVTALRNAISGTLENVAWANGIELSRMKSRLGRDPIGRTAALESRGDALASRVTDLERQAAESREQATQLNSQLAEAGGAVRAAMTRGAELERSATDLQQRATDLEAQLVTAVAQNADAEARLKEAEARLDAAAARVNAAEERARAAELELNGIVDTLRTQAGGNSHGASMPRIAQQLQRIGRRAFLRMRGNPLFDADWYGRRYRDVKAADAYRQWQEHGVNVGRNPNAYFETDWYLDNNPDVQRSGMNPLDHYYLYGAAEGRQPGPSLNRETISQGRAN
jgi:glycosyltransferase involved in cell wall biosynthesis/chaperonin cofactor prefoldin